MIYLGKINGAFGVNGLVRITSFCDPIESIKKYKPIFIEDCADTLTVQFMRNHGKQLIARVGSVLDVDNANNLKGKLLFIERSALPDLCPDEFYYSDLEACYVMDELFKVLGPVLSIQNYGAGDILEFLDETSLKKIMVPINKRFVKEINIKEKKVVIFK